MGWRFGPGDAWPREHFADDMEAGPCRFHAFYLAVNGVSTWNTDDVLRVFNDEADIAAILQENASERGDASQGDER